MKTRFLIVSLFTLLAAISVNAQWYQQMSGTAADLNSVHFLNDTTGYAVGFKTNIRKTTDGGTTSWFTGGSTGGVSDKFVVKMLNKDTILIGQANGTFKRTTNGSSASIWSNDIFGGNTAFGIYDIFCLSSTNIIAVGGSATNTSTGGYMITASLDAGATWTPVNVSGEPTMFGIHALSSTRYVAVGGSKTIFRSTDAGANWTKVKTGGVDTAFFDVHFPTKDTGYAVGGSVATPTAGGIIFRTIDSGKTWTKVGVGLAPNTLYGVHFVTGKTGYVVGNGGTIEVTVDAGKNWTKQISPVSTDLNKIYFSSRKIGYIAGLSGVILKTTDGGFIPPLVVNTGGNKSICPGFCATIGGTSIVSGGTAPYTYSWNPVTNTNTSLVVCPTVNTTYTVTVKDANSVTATGTVSVSIYAVAAVSFSGLPSKYCLNGNNISLVGNPAGGIFSGSGITGASLNPIVAGSGTHTVSYTYTDTHGCIKTASTQSFTITSAPAAGSLCMVTVDSVTSDKNIIVWQKPVSSSIDSFRIYRQNSSGAFTYIGHVPYASPAKYPDVGVGVNPNSQSYSYAVSVRDTCGIESALSNTNTTIFLHIPEFETPNMFTLTWDDYTGYVPTEYEIWRKDNVAASWVKIATQPYLNPSNRYSDSTLPPNSSRYRIQAVNPAGGCTINGSAPLRSTMSNISADYTGISDVSLDNLLSIYPNPNRGTFTFQISGIKYKTASIKVYDMLGKLVFESTLKNQRSEISIPGIVPGIYQLQVITNIGIANKKITVE